MIDETDLALRKCNVGVRTPTINPRGMTFFQLSNRALQAFEHAMSPGHGFLNSSVDKLLHGLMPFRKGQDGLEVAQCEGELREVLQETLPYRSIAAV